jgi:superfamily II DNA or RNA helicase
VGSGSSSKYDELRKISTCKRSAAAFGRAVLARPATWWTLELFSANRGSSMSVFESNLEMGVAPSDSLATGVLTPAAACPTQPPARKPFRLRPYQKAAVQAVISRFRDENTHRMLLYLPTGAGKTVIATFIIRSMRALAGFSKSRTLFIAHRREILDQTVRTINQHLPNLTIAIEQGERSSDIDADVTVASVQSLLRRKDRYDPKSFDLIICDECHRALAPSWEEVIGYFYSHATGKTLLLGMTATPRRTDGKSALEVFGQTAFEISRTDLEDLGFLVPMRYFTVRTDLKLDRVKLSGGDFQVGALSAVMNTVEHRAMAIKAWLEQGAGNRTIAFCASVEHAHQLAADFCSVGVPAEVIDGKTKERHQVLQRFRDGEFQVLTNYGVLTEGFDDPGVSCVLMARPTTSPLVYTQCVGRGLRSAPGKTACVVIDIVDRSTHELQYGAVQMAELPSKWRCRGGDPFRQAQSVRAIKVTSPEAFLRIREAASLEEVQSILMSLPAGVVVAGLDGEPVLHYKSAAGACPADQAEAEVRQLLRQAHCRGAKVAVQGDTVHVTFRIPEAENERYAYLKWHLAQVTGRTIIYTSPQGRRKPSNPRTLLKSMLPERCRIAALDADRAGQIIVANITGLTPNEMADIANDFSDECGMQLDLKGQLALF